MSNDKTIMQIKQELGNGLLDVQERSPHRIFLNVKPGAIVETSRLMFEGLGARLQIASGVDTSTEIEILYHWALDQLDQVFSVRVCLDRENPEIDTITSVCVAAEWIEREMWELLGIQFHNHPDMRHLLLSDDWPEGKYPLRRDYEA